jgi:SAM-dependent methyltransferase
MHWRVKGLIQKCLSSMPWGRSLNDRLQRRFGELRQPERNVLGKLEDWRLSLSYLRDCEFDVRGSTLFEVGTGWYPTLPICFSLAGARRIITYDVVRHIDTDLTFRMIAALESHLESIAEACGTSVDEVHDRYLELLQAEDIDALLKRARVEYCAPTDARATKLAPDSVDLVYSNSVMEHVPKDLIRDLMSESRRILRPGGLALHNVACNDHYAHLDPRISFANYLRYSESQWRKWNNSLQYQNRLRAPEFLDLATEVGFEIILKRTCVRPGTREALTNFDVASEFRRFSMEDLSITTIDFIARKPLSKMGRLAHEKCDSR